MDAGSVSTRTTATSAKPHGPLASVSCPADETGGRRRRSMRLIDADALMERMREQAGCRDCNSYNGVRCRACTWDDAINLVDEAPAVKATAHKPYESRRKLPCMCGCKRINVWCGAKTYQCRCDDCGKQGPVADTEIDAIRAWNKLIEEVLE